MLSILRGLDVSQYNIFVAVEKFEDTIPNDISECNRIRLNYSNNSYKDAKYLSKLLTKNEIDILHSWDYKSSFTEALACRFSKVKYLYTKKNNSWSKRWLLKSMLSNHIVYDNPNMKERFFKSFFLNRKASFIPHGVDLSIFKPIKQEDSKRFNLCCLGNIVENKNQAQIIEALNELPDNVHLNLYGKEDENYRFTLNNLVAKYSLQNRVHFLGYIKNQEIPNIMSHQKLFVLASKKEGLPVSILEALACGIPVLSSNSGGGSSYILDTENSGFIFTSTKDLVEKIKLMMINKELYKRLSLNAVANVKERFSLQKEINAYKDLYLKILTK